MPRIYRQTDIQPDADGVSNNLLCSVIWLKKHCFNMQDNNRLSIARFMHESISLRDMVGRYGNLLSLLSEDELNCIVNYLATY